MNKTSLGFNIEENFNPFKKYNKTNLPNFKFSITPIRDWDETEINGDARFTSSKGILIQGALAGYSVCAVCSTHPLE